MINDIVITIFNKLLDLNSGSKSELAKYSGKSFLLNIVGIQLKASISQDGSLEQRNDLDNSEISVNIIIPMSVTTYLLNQDKIELFRQIEITGDKNFGVNFLEILSKINFAGIYAKVSPLNGVILQQLENVFKIIQDYYLNLSKTMGLSFSEYLVYETGDIVSRHKIEQFNLNVDELKERTSLLEKKVQKLIGNKL